MPKALALLVAALLAARAILPGPAAALEAATPALTVSVVAPAERAWPETVPASGWIRPWQEAVIAAETGGLRIVEVLVEVGATVTKGQVLARLAQDSVAAQLRGQEAAVATARASLAKARADAERARQLGQTGAVSEQTLAERVTAEQIAEAGLASAEAALDIERIRLAQTTIRAIDDGLITSSSALLGSVVGTGTELFRMIHQQRVEWQAEVSARHLPRISEGQRATIDTPDGPVEGRVRLVSPTVDTGTGRAVVHVALEDGGRPRTGLYATGSIELDTTTALTVPETAITFRDGLSYVFVADASGRARRARVETGRRNAGEVEILSGLDGSSSVVVSGGAFLSDNVLVSIVEDGR